MRLSVRALRRARPELFVNYISRAFIAPEPPATEKPPPPPQTASRAPGAPASRRPDCDGSAGPEISGSPTRDLAPEKGGKSPVGEVCSRRAGQSVHLSTPDIGLQDRIARTTLFLLSPSPSGPAEFRIIVRLPGRFPSYFEPRSREEEQTEGESWASRSGRKYTSSPVAQGTMQRRHVRWTDGTWTPDGSTTARQCVLG
ncbi:unnamed protein product [Rangifer tarandus platyrhynchus]|uniref:Uncharacterized protein n=2 Tax=Rangifer tarandus platyrhynchus TaxID=3082113 RepID=A0ACB0FEW4_RANTA|nr:unnamed protein product [Rangifer tarandus platyrhynchus]CAI9711499.1 unnamed protein product [Rangifer tarandus platyrhynchus]